MSPRKVRISKRQRMAEEWRPLYEVAERVKELAPWRWMREESIFGVQDPKTGEFGYVSVMGMLGEHLSVAVYLGANAIHQFGDLANVADVNDEWEVGSRLMLIPQMQASFEDQDMVEKEDMNVMRRLKLKYRGRFAYPVFRTIRPGCPLWILDKEQIPFLTHVLEQTLDVASRCKEDMSLLYPDDVDDDEEMYLLRIPTVVDGEIMWADKIGPVAPFTEEEITAFLVSSMYEALQNVPRVGNSVEIDLFMVMTPVMERGDEYPYYPFSLMIVDVDSGMILAQEMLMPLPTLVDMYETVPEEVARLLLQSNIMPYEIYTQTPEITAVLQPIFNNLDVPVIEVDSLDMVNEAKAAMFEHLKHGF